MKPPDLFRGLLLAALAGAVSSPGPASAQLTRADSAAVLLTAAEDFADRGVDDIADAIYRHVVERYPGTVAAETARSLLARADSRQSPAGGEVELKVWSALYGIWQGIAIPLAASATGPEPHGLGLLLGGPAGFLMGRELALARPRSLGQARAITWGGTWGMIQGWGLGPGPGPGQRGSLCGTVRLRRLLRRLRRRIHRGRLHVDDRRGSRGHRRWLGPGAARDHAGHGHLGHAGQPVGHVDRLLHGVPHGCRGRRSHRGRDDGRQTPDSWRAPWPEAAFP